MVRDQMTEACACQVLAKWLCQLLCEKQCIYRRVICAAAGNALRVAVACDDGVLRIFAAEGLAPGLMYQRSLPALGTRLLSVAWHPGGQSVLVGSAAGSLHAWQIASGRELMRINVGERHNLFQNSRALRQMCLAVLNPATLHHTAVLAVAATARADGARMLLGDG